MAKVRPSTPSDAGRRLRQLKELLDLRFQAKAQAARAADGYDRLYARAEVAAHDAAILRALQERS